MSNFFDIGQLNLFGTLVLAVILGAFIGLEREHIRKAAGVKTNALVCLGAALFTILSVNFARQIDFSGPGLDPARIASQIVVGIGFIGAGLIIFREERIQNLTTAATIWVVAAIGMALGFGFYLLAVLTTLLVFITLELLTRLKKWESKIWKDSDDSL